MEIIKLIPPSELMGLLQLELLNPASTVWPLWVQHTLQHLGCSSQNQSILIQVSLSICIYLIPTPFTPHLNIRGLPCYATPWVFASVVWARPPRRYWHCPSELPGRQSRPDEKVVKMYQRQNLVLRVKIRALCITYLVLQVYSSPVFHHIIPIQWNRCLWTSTGLAMAKLFLCQGFP